MPIPLILTNNTKSTFIFVVLNMYKICQQLNPFSLSFSIKDKQLMVHWSVINIKLHVLYELSFFGLLQEVKIRDGNIFWVPVNVNDFTPPFDRIPGHMSGQKMGHSNPIGHLPEFLDRQSINQRRRLFSELWTVISQHGHDFITTVSSCSGNDHN